MSIVIQDHGKAGSSTLNSTHLPHLWNASPSLTANGMLLWLACLRFVLRYVGLSWRGGLSGFLLSNKLQIACSTTLLEMSWQYCWHFNSINSINSRHRPTRQLEGWRASRRGPILFASGRHRSTGQLEGRGASRGGSTLFTSGRHSST